MEAVQKLSKICKFYSQVENNCLLSPLKKKQKKKKKQMMMFDLCSVC